MMTLLRDFYGFTHTPFTRTIASADLYQAQGLHEVQARLTFALQHRIPALITGDVGTGKSTALRAFAHSLDRNVYALVYLSNPHLTVTTLYRQILLALQVEPAFGFLRLLPQLRSTLADLDRKGRAALLVVDEAHLLPPELLEQLRFLLNEDMDSTSLLTLVLLGQTDLAHKLRFAPYEALSQRIAVRYQLKPFDLEETAGYVKHHLRVAGFEDGPIFSDSFISAVHNHTKGVARKINNICRNALLLGATEFKEIIDESDLKRILLDLEGVIA
jgi:type II secretory pathway predicted ATPase ExeA